MSCTVSKSFLNLLGVEKQWIIEIKRIRFFGKNNCNIYNVWYPQWQKVKIFCKEKQNEVWLQYQLCYFLFCLTEQKIKEFENHLKEQRKIKDIMDEIDTLKMEKEKNEKDLNRYINHPFRMLNHNRSINTLDFHK